MLSAQRIDGADILIVSPTPTWPLDYGNRKRIFSICENLKSRGARIHFLHYPSEGEWRHHYPKTAFEIMTKQWHHTTLSPPTRNLHEPAIGDDHAIDEWWDRGLESQLKWFFSVNAFDAVIVNYTWLSKALEFVPAHTLKVLDTHDRFSNRGDLLEVNGISKEFFHTTQYEEAKGLERADIVWAIKEDEECFFRQLLQEKSQKKTNVTTLLHVEQQDLKREHFPYEENGYLTIGMIGARNNINLTNAKNFLQIALPIFEKYMSPVKIIIAGTMCKDLGDYEHSFVELLGRVESVESFYESLDIAIVPMTFSTGLKIKVGEALAFGVPVVSHRHAFEGYPPSHHLHEVDSIEEIATEIVQLAYDPDELIWLKKASEDSQSKLMSEVDKTMDNLIQSIKTHQETTVIIIPEMGYKASSLYRLHLDQIIGILFEKYRIILYYPHTVDEERLAFLDYYSDWTTVYTDQITEIPSQVVLNTTLKDIDEIWNIKLVWNYDPLFNFEYEGLGDEILYIDDHALSLLNDTKEINPEFITFDSLHTTIVDHSVTVWENSPFSYNNKVLSEDLWKGRLPVDCASIYILFSGRIVQYKFWRTVFEHTLHDKYKLIWITELAEDLEDEKFAQISAEAILNDVTFLREPARVVFEINLANSHLIASISWLMHVSKRQIIKPKDMGDATGKVLLDDIVKIIPKVVADLEYAKSISEFFNGYAFDVDDIDKIMMKYKENKLEKSLELFYSRRA